MSASPARPRLLGICANVAGTGLTRVMRTLTSELSDELDIDYLGIGYGGSLVDDGAVRIHPTNPRGGDVLAAFQAIDMIRADPPDVLMVLHDIWLFDYYCQVFEPVRELVRFVGYVPIDGDVVHPRTVRSLGELDHVVVYTGWAREQVERAFARLAADDHALRPPAVSVAGHGVDRVFDPAPELVAAAFDASGRRRAKREVFPALADDDDHESFIVLNANRPAIRKRVDLTIEAFARFAADKPTNVRLCLHQAITEDDTHELLDLATQLGVADRLIYNPLSPDGGPISDLQLARLYAACDVGVNTSMGEGWGLVSFEHAATGATQIVPRHSACGALWDDSTAVMVDPTERGMTHFSPLELAAVDPDDVAAAMEALYVDRDRLRTLARAGSAFANRPEFGWDAVANQWRAILRTL